MRRVLIAMLAAAAMAAVYGVLIWAFFVYVWPNLPPWLAMIGFIALAAFAIGSPIFWLARISRNPPIPPHLLKRTPPDAPDRRR